MPEYLFKNPETGEVKSIIQGINEVHEYSENGKQWSREFTVPQASIDTNYDEMSAKDFVEKTRNKKGTLGEIWDKSKELSQKRTEVAGHDSIREKVEKRYKDRTGKDHPFLNK